MDSAAKKMNDVGCGQAARIMENLAASPYIKCDICLGILMKPVTMPCDHYFCDACFEAKAVKDGESFVCPVCQKIAMPMPRCQLLVKFCEVLQKCKAPGKRQVPLNSADMHSRGLRVPKRPVRYHSPEPEAAKRRRKGPTNLDDISVTSAQALEEFIKPRSMAHTGVKVEPAAELPPQTPSTKVGSWLRNQPSPKVAAARIRHAAVVRHNQSVKPAEECPEQPRKQQAGARGAGSNSDHATAKLSDSGVHTGDSPECAVAKDTLSAAKPGLKGRRLHDNSSPSGVQNVSANSPGWNRSKKASKELQRNEKTLKALDVSGGELSKRSGSASRNRTLNSANNETVKAMGLQKAPRHLKKNKTQAETSKHAVEVHREVFESDFLGLPEDWREPPATEMSKANVEETACQKEKAEAERSARDKLKSRAAIIAQEREKNISKARLEKKQAEAAKGDLKQKREIVSKPTQEKSIAVDEKIVPKHPKVDTQEKPKGDSRKAEKEGDLPRDVSKDVSKQTSVTSRIHTQNASNNETVKELPVRKAVRRLKRNKPQAEIFEFGGETQAFETDPVNVNEDIRKPGTKSPALETSLAAVEATDCQKDEAKADKSAHNKLKSQTEKVGIPKTQVEAAKCLFEKKRASVSKPTGEKSFAVAEKIVPKQAKADRKQVAEGNLFDDVKALPKRSEAGNANRGITKANELKAAQEMTNAYVERAKIIHSLENAETAAQEKLKGNGKKVGHKEVDAVLLNAVENQTTVAAEKVANKIAKVGNENSESKKIRPNQKSPRQLKRGRPRLVKTKTETDCLGISSSQIIGQNVIAEPVPAARTKIANQRENGAEATLQKQMRRDENLIGNHNSKVSLRYVAKAISDLENNSDTESSEDEGYKEKLSRAIHNLPPLKVNLSIHNVPFGIREVSPEFAGFPSLNHSDIVLETLEQSPKDIPTIDCLTHSNNADVSMKKDDGEKLHVIAEPSTMKKASAPPKAVGNRSREVAVNKSVENPTRKTFSLEADTQDLASITLIEEDSFDKRILEIAEANKNSNTASKNVGKVVNLTSTPINRQSNAKPSIDFEINGGPDCSTDSLEENYVKQFRIFLRNMLTPNEYSGKDMSHTEFRELRAFFVAFKGPFETTSGEHLRGTRVFMELDPSSISKEVKIRQNPDPSNKPTVCTCKCRCNAGKSLAAANNGIDSNSDEENGQSMVVNYVPSFIDPKSDAAPKCKNKPVAVDKQAECGQSISINGKVNDYKMPMDKITQPVSSQETEYSAFDTPLSDYDTAFESFGGNGQRLNGKCTQGTSEVSASLRAAIGAGDQGSSQIARESRNVQMGMRGEGDSIQQKTLIPLKQDAAHKAGSAHLIDPEPDTSDLDFIPDTIPNDIYRSKTLHPVPPPVTVLPSTTKLVPSQIAPQVPGNQGMLKKGNHEGHLADESFRVVNRGFPYAYVPGCSTVAVVNGTESSKNTQGGLVPREVVPIVQPSEKTILPGTSQPTERIIQTGMAPKTNQANDRTLIKSRDKPCPKSRKQFLATISSQAVVPRLTDPTASDARCEDVPETINTRKFRRIVAPAESSESESEVCGTVDLASDDNNLLNRLSDNEDRDSLNDLLDEHCRDIHSPPRESCEMVPSFQVSKSRGTGAEGALPRMQVSESPETPESFIDAQRIVMMRERVGTKGDEDHGDDDNDVTHFEEFSEQGQAKDEEDVGDDSDNIVKQTPERQLPRPKNIRRGPVLPPPHAPPSREETTSEALVPGMKRVLGGEMTTFRKAVHIVSSGLKAEDTNLLLQMVKLVGATHDAEFTEQTTHLVAFVDEEGAAPRTVKMITAIARGTMAVSMSWVRACIAAQTLLPAASFEVVDSIFGDSPRRSRLGGSRILRDFAFFLMPPYNGPVDKASFERILTFAGAAVVTNPRDKAGKKYLVALTDLVDSPEKKLLHEACMKEMKSLLLAYAWVHLTVCSYKLRPIWNHMPLHTVVPPHIKSSYPSQMFDAVTSSDEESSGSDEER